MSEYTGCWWSAEYRTVGSGRAVIIGGEVVELETSFPVDDVPETDPEEYDALIAREPLFADEAARYEQDWGQQ